MCVCVCVCVYVSVCVFSEYSEVLAHERITIQMRKLDLKMKLEPMLSETLVP